PPAALGQSRRLRPGSLPAGAQRGTLALRVPAVWRGTAPVHRHGHGVDGGGDRARHVAPALPSRARARPPRRARSERHAAAEERHSHVAAPPLRAGAAGRAGRARPEPATAARRRASRRDKLRRVSNAFERFVASLTDAGLSIVDRDLEQGPRVTIAHREDVILFELGWRDDES